MRKYFPYILVIIIFLAVVTITIGTYFLGSNAEINLSAPKDYQVGDLVVLDATGSVAELLNWTILPKTKNFKIVGKTAYFSSSAPDRYTVIITATNNGTLATKVIFLTPRVKKSGIKIPGTNDPGPFEVPQPLIDPNIKRIKLLIDGGIISSLDTAILAASKLDLTTPDFNTFKEFKKWIDDNS